MFEFLWDLIVLLIVGTIGGALIAMSGGIVVLIIFVGAILLIL